MIKFFRHIRKSLLMESKTSKYFKYAIGEIVLVVIGILIALQINNWNNNRLESSKEQLFLKNLESDVKANLIEYKNTYNRSLQAYLASNEILEIIKSKKPITNQNKIDSLVHLMINEFTSLDLIDGSINEILNTGSLNVIKDAKLRKKLSNWSKTINDYQDDVKITNDYLFDKLIPSTENKLLLRNSKVPEKFSSIDNVKNITKSNFTIDYNTTLKTVEFENQVYFHVLNILFTLNSYEITETYLNDLLELIEVNIKE